MTADVRRAVAARFKGMVQAPGYSLRGLLLVSSVVALGFAGWSGATGRILGLLGGLAVCALVLGLGATAQYVAERSGAVERQQRRDEALRGEIAFWSRWKRMSYLVLCVVLGVGAIALRIWLPIPGAPDTSPTTVVTTPEAIKVDTVPPGTCLLDAYPDVFVRPTSCDGPHGSEIVALLTYPGPPGAPYPPIAEMFRQALDQCHTAFDAYVGGTGDQSAARYFVVLPTLPNWRAGERIVVCFADGRDGMALTHSVRKSGT